MSGASIAVFGATGALGRQVVRLALDGGHAVRAHARTPSKLAIAHGRLELVEGDFADADSIRRVVAGCDAVLSCVGYAPGQDPAIYGVGMGHVVTAMHQAGARRLVAISGAGLELDGDRGGVGRRVMILLLGLFARHVLAAKRAEWALLRDADVDWTLVRVPRMVDRPATGRVAVHLDHVGGRPMVAYADVAAWMLGQVADDTFVGKAPFVSGG